MYLEELIRDQLGESENPAQFLTERLWTGWSRARALDNFLAQLTTARPQIWLSQSRLGDADSAAVLVIGLNPGNPHWIRPRMSGCVPSPSAKLGCRGLMACWRECYSQTASWEQNFSRGSDSIFPNRGLITSRFISALGVTQEAFTDRHFSAGVGAPPVCDCNYVKKQPEGCRVQGGWRERKEDMKLFPVAS